MRGFFERLDEELNKVNQFYKTQESEFLERGDILNNQLQILLDLKRILNDRRWKNSPGKTTNSGSVPSSWSSSPRSSDYSGKFLFIYLFFGKIYENAFFLKVRVLRSIRRSFC